MKPSTFSIFVCMAFTAALPCYAQQSSGSTPSPAASAPAAAPTAAPATAPSPDKSGPSADTIKRAKSVGMHPETHGGKTQFCWEDSNTGSRFPTKKCTDEAGVDGMIAMREAAKQNMRQSMSGTSAH